MLANLGRGMMSDSNPEEIFLYLTTVGRKSGLPRQIEIWFVEDGGCHYMLSGGYERADWVKNLRQTPQVQFSVGRRADQTAVLPLTHALARVVPADDPIAERILTLMDAKYGWREGLIVEVRPSASL
ncbi:MAG: DUF385 domain-containing protein [Chloroflexi bacterium CFX4]|nr:DUF385 domain-containing protein [Chloroflexi bacterium CFX4]